MAAEAGAAPLVDLVCEDARWAVAGIAEVAERAARGALAGAGLDPGACEISLLAADDARIAALNAAFRGKAEPTNVLAWPAWDGSGPASAATGEPVFLGDLALAFETCAREAAAAGVPLGDHLAHLVVHGVLHLVGHDHDAAGDAARMEALETKVLASLGVADPYRP